MMPLNQPLGVGDFLSHIEGKSRRGPCSTPLLPSCSSWRTARSDVPTLHAVRIAVAADEITGVAEAVVEELRRRGHEPIPHGALADAEREDWAWASEAAARDVAVGRAEQGVVCCWTGTGASIAANKVEG